MINENFVRESENISSFRNSKQLLPEKRTGRFKNNALGDVQNTLHFRSANLGNLKNSVKPAVKDKPTGFSKFVLNRSTLSVKETKPQQVTNSNINERDRRALDAVDFNEFDSHNHALCEQVEQNCVKDLFLEYKLSEEQINTLVKSIKQFRTVVPFTELKFSTPCEDIELAEKEKYEDSFSYSDMLDNIDIEIPDISAPLAVI